MAKLKRILVGVDGSDSSRAALQWAYDEARHHGASLVVLATWHLPALPMTPPYGSLPPAGYELIPQEEAFALLKRFVGALDVRAPSIEVRMWVERGNPAKVLIERSKHADLVVVGLRGHGGFAGMLLGSVSQHLVAHAHCPVVVVR